MVHARIISIVLLGATLSMSMACNRPTGEQQEVVVVNEKVSSPSLLSLEEVENALSDSSWAVIDLRRPHEFAEGHLPGALQVWRDDIQRHDLPYSGMCATREQIEQLFSELGISTGQKILIYDAKGLVDAARLWWILKYYGYDDAYMFDGGLAAWQRSNRPLSTEPIHKAPSEFVLEGPSRADWHAQRSDVEAALADSAIVILDTRSQDEFEGRNQKLGAFRAGHIPGALWVDYCLTFDYRVTQEFYTLEAIEELYQSRGLHADTPIIVYCHSGVRSAHTTFVLRELLGYRNVRNYDGSWTEWSFFEELPIEAVADEETS
ncbi:sulfurtransferase [Cryomorphaceae bacterium]|nr:sulfurtransferase [Cryomorphaceae bacterium]